MSEDVEFVYNTRLRRRSLSIGFHTRVAAAFHNDIQRDPENTIDGTNEADPFRADEEDASDIETDMVIEANEVSDSDEEMDEDEMEGENQSAAASGGFFVGKDGTMWSKNEPNAVGRYRHHNIMRFRAGPKEQNSVAIEVFKKFFSHEISFVIITQTNRYGRDAVDKWNEENPDSKPRVWKELTDIELDAFIGILLAAGVTHNNMQKSELLWQTDALPIFRAAMSHKRFLSLLRYIRFDDGRTREFRQQTDKAAPIRDVWNFMNQNLAKNYSPHENFTIDEQLYPYRGRTKFTQYIPSKPAKYGIKIWWACDSKTKYPLQGKLYLGRNEGEERETNQGENVLLQLANRYTNTGRTAIADNFFTTLEGVKRLARIGIGFVGTIRVNKRCIPDEMKKHPSRPVLSSQFGFHEDVTICSYVPKKNKVVNLLSSVHYTNNCVGEAMKPEAIIYYNENKSGVDCMDQMVTHFTTKRPTRRWTLAFFFNILDVMALASFCICKEIDRLEKPDARRNFLNTLSKSLVLPNIENRMNNIHIVKQYSTRLAFEAFFGRPIAVSIQTHKPFVLI